MKSSERFELMASDVPRHTKLALGRKGVVEIDLDKIPRHILGGEDGLVVRGLDEFESRSIAGTTPGLMPFFSPDGQWIGYFGPGQLKKIPVSGGAASTPPRLSP